MPGNELEAVWQLGAELVIDGVGQGATAERASELSRRSGCHSCVRLTTGS